MEKTEKNLHEKFVLYGKNARKWTRKCALLLPEIARLRIWEKKGFENIYEYARILAGMSANAVNAALWTMRKIEDKPALKRVVEEKGIGAVRPIANLVTPETDKFWAEKVREMSSHALEVYAKEFRKSDFHACRAAKNCYENQDLFSEIKTEQIAMNLKPETAYQLKKLKGQEDWEIFMQKLLTAYQAQVEAKKPTSEEVPQKAKSRYIPAKIKKYVIAKTAGACAFPECVKPYEILHHTDRFALTYMHDPDKLVPLCKPHEQLVHLGLIENENQFPEKWKIREKADTTDLKHLIDLKVLKYRTAQNNSS